MQNKAGGFGLKAPPANGPGTAALLANKVEKMDRDQPSVSRSQSSLAFEAFWRALPKDGCAPHRREFKPERATKFLKNLMLIEAPLNAAARLKLRLVGSAIQLRIQRDITGCDYLDFLAPAHHAGVVESCLAMLHRPCGLWQCMDVHYERGFAQALEVTAFPLLADPGGMALILALVEPLTALVTPEPATGRAMLVDTASRYVFIDVGAGLPVWPAA
jgi:hypothetical protein